MARLNLPGSLDQSGSVPGRVTNFLLHTPLEADGPEKAGPESLPDQLRGLVLDGAFCSGNSLVQHGTAQSVLS